jgi:hypothetical protein
MCLLRAAVRLFPKNWKNRQPSLFGGTGNEGVISRRVSAEETFDLLIGSVAGHAVTFLN